ncbi:MAG: hypothetical protein RR290_02820 [Clostridia bacterium]
MNRRNFKEKKRFSLITYFIIFLILLNIFIFLLNYFALDFSSSELDILAMQDINFEDKSYIEAKEIKEKYGIDIIYDNNVSNFAFKVDATIQKNLEIIYNNIVEIKKTLSKYPDAFFIDNNLTIIILDEFNNNNIALASRNKLNEFKIYISNNDTYERSLHHELFHIFEYKININSKNEFANWNNLNPSDFVYEKNIDKLNNKYVYEKYINDDEIYFVTKYSKVSEKEDRAEIFAEIMTFKNKPTFLNSGTKINKKATNIIDIMNYKLNNNVNNLLYWNRF